MEQDANDVRLLLPPMEMTEDRVYHVGAIPPIARAHCLALRIAQGPYGRSGIDAEGDIVRFVGGVRGVVRMRISCATSPASMAAPSTE
jgi:hypothetical protein